MRELERGPEVDAVIVFVHGRKMAVQEGLEGQHTESRRGNHGNDTPISAKAFQFASNDDVWWIVGGASASRNAHPVDQSWQCVIRPGGHARCNCRRVDVLHRTRCRDVTALTRGKAVVTGTTTAAATVRLKSA